ncbi:MAG: YihY/virulence factor BrkB family protein [Bacteroidaceae bacterium]|nr:YihY/virulence factor BrkB family protein [Bacteroidaceae bacterium]
MKSCLLDKYRAKAKMQLVVLKMTFSYFATQKVGYRAVALAFFTTIAFIPCLAMILKVVSGFGLQTYLETMLYETFDGSHDFVRNAFEYAQNVLDVGGHVGLFSSICFLSLVFWLLMQIENAFNYVWNIKKNRNFWKRLGFYVAIILILPFVMLIWGSTILQFSASGNGIMSYLVDVEFWKNISGFLSWIIIYTLLVLSLSVMYKYIPSAHVDYRFALRAALVTGLALSLFQLVYVETQIFFNRMDSVFGAIAAIPFMMIWFNVIWFLVLFGAELTFSIQNYETVK